ncbi:D-tyrosyl-tRNA(Tyr) deacylase [Carboxydocella sporoproducens DSM 16521]|uniref:D-aminoacyl-tRNA deacylase n=2 Tax=Carboxydocella TaxID=178898 RepID=A0A1T4PH78_9FIRM|nr:MULTISPECIES: D-aminoacyl-tRNA deacylase [Carboxydocella]AVX21457.1 D-tyrosyl-tRNA(Tyr) deacylase [Carboxydocella thermautotrophica]SJZ90616.1 D-tyrosyl-tRNA(Tyr) deacylase [Carboxydocella sporoproducens DSM 16521]
MRAVVQRARYGRVTVAGQVIGEIGPGLVVLLGVGQDDREEDARYLAEKIAHLRIFPDQEGKLNLSVKDSGGEVLLVSQFTLYGDCRKGRRPSFTEAAPPEQALALYERVRALLEEHGIKVATGQFQAEMLVELANDGPVTMLLDSKRIF